MRLKLELAVIDITLKPLIILTNGSLLVRLKLELAVINITLKPLIILTNESLLVGLKVSGELAVID